MKVFSWRTSPSSVRHTESVQKQQHQFHQLHVGKSLINIRKQKQSCLVMQRLLVDRIKSASLQACKQKSKWKFSWAFGTENPVYISCLVTGYNRATALHLWPLTSSSAPHHRGNLAAGNISTWRHTESGENTNNECVCSDLKTSDLNNRHSFFKW